MPESVSFQRAKKILCVVYIHKAFSRQFFFIKESGKKYSKTEPYQPVYTVTACFPFFFLFTSTHAAADRQGHTAMGLSLSSFFVQERADKHKELRSASGIQSAMHAGIRIEERKREKKGISRKAIQYGKNVT